MENEYLKQVNDFCKKTNTEISITRTPELACRKPLWAEDTINDNFGNQYTIIIRRKNIKEPMRFSFWDSIANKETKKRPNKYDILACLTKYDPGNFENFCSEYGYNTDNIKDLKTFKAVEKEWKEIKRIFSDCLEELREIN